MRFEWDPDKNRRNQRDHDGISFQLASRVFREERLLVYPDRIDEKTGEQRWHAVGRVGGQAIYVVTHVYREDESDEKEEVIRIISARKASQREGRRYLEQAGH